MAQKPGKNRPKALILRTEVCQGNPLIQARKEFDTLGMRLFMLGLRGLNPHFSLNDKTYDKEFPKLFIPTSQVVELFGGNTKYLHDLKPACEKLFDAIIELNYENGGFTLLHLFNELHYEPEEGLYLQFDNKMRPYLLDLFESKGYTQISVEQIFYLTSPYAVRLIELMLQYQNIPEFKIRLEIKREMTIDELKFALNVPKDAYDGRINNFRKFVLDDPIAEINEKTIYQMSYKVVKQGRNVTGFEFCLNMQAEPPATTECFRYVNKAIDGLRQLGFRMDAAQEIFSHCIDENDCLNRIATAKLILERQEKRDKTPINNRLGFFRQAIIENWKLGTRKRISPPILAPLRPKKAAKPKEIFESNRQKKAEMLETPTPPPVSSKEKLTPSIVEMLIDMLNDSKQRQYVGSFLKFSGWTLEEFKEKYVSGRVKKNAPETL